MLRQLRPAIMSVLIITLAFGIVFPFVITAIAQTAFRHQANGSLITSGGRIIGSELIGQSFTGPGYFHPRPSAAGDGYDAANSGGTNLGPTSAKLINGVHGGNTSDDFDGVKDLTAAYRRDNHLAPAARVPADAVTRSASGLDPHISPANAYMQVASVAHARGLSKSRVRQLIAANTETRQFGVLGEPRVNVLKLNMALDKAARRGGALSPPGAEVAVR